MAKKKVAAPIRERMPPDDFEKIRSQVHTVVSTAVRGMSLEDLLKDIKAMFGYDFSELAKGHGYTAVQLLDMMVEDVIVGTNRDKYWIQAMVKQDTKHVQDLIQRTRGKVKNKKRLVRFTATNGRFTKSAVAPTYYPHFAGRCLAPPPVQFHGFSRSHFFAPVTGSGIFPSPMAKSSGARPIGNFWALSPSASAANKEPKARPAQESSIPPDQRRFTREKNGSQPSSTLSQPVIPMKVTVNPVSQARTVNYEPFSSSFPVGMQRPMFYASMLANSQPSQSAQIQPPPPSRVEPPPQSAMIQPPPPPPKVQTEQQKVAEYVPVTKSVSGSTGQATTVLPPRRRFTREKVETDSQDVSSSAPTSAKVPSGKSEVQSAPVSTSNPVLRPVKQEIPSPDKNETVIKDIKPRLNWDIKPFIKNYLQNNKATSTNVVTNPLPENQDGHDDIENIVNMFGGTAYLPVIGCEYHLTKNRQLTLTEPPPPPPKVQTEQQKVAEYVPVTKSVSGSTGQATTALPPRRRFTREKVETDSQHVSSSAPTSAKVPSDKSEVQSAPLSTSNPVLRPVKQEISSPDKNVTVIKDIKPRLNWDIKPFIKNYLQNNKATSINVVTNPLPENQDGHDDIENIVNMFGGTAYLPVIGCEYHLTKNRQLTLTELQKIYKSSSLIVKDILSSHFELSVKHHHLVLTTGKHCAPRCHDNYNSLFEHIISQPEQCCTLDSALLAKHNIRPNVPAFIDRVKKFPQLSALFKISIEPGRLIIRSDVPSLMSQEN
uniref:HTH OST-type domain-containing protein n=1 Tax=Panagrolaimus sp. JU765 TaxID=591449 RepID=A0AC34QPP5_9BILA